MRSPTNERHIVSLGKGKKYSWPIVKCLVLNSEIYIVKEAGVAGDLQVPFHKGERGISKLHVRERGKNGGKGWKIPYNVWNLTQP